MESGDHTHKETNIHQIKEHTKMLTALELKQRKYTIMYTTTKQTGSYERVHNPSIQMKRLYSKPPEQR